MPSKLFNARCESEGFINRAECHAPTINNIDPYATHTLSVVFLEIGVGDVLVD